MQTMTIATEHDQGFEGSGELRQAIETARRACVSAGEAPADGPWELDDFFITAESRTLKGEHVGVVEAALKTRQSVMELRGAREGLLQLCQELAAPVDEAIQWFDRMDHPLSCYLSAIVACSRVDVPGGIVALAWGDERPAPDGAELAADAVEMRSLLRRIAEVRERMRANVERRRPDVLRANVIGEHGGERAAMMWALHQLGAGPTKIAELMGEAPVAPARGDRKAALARREAADAVTDVLRRISQKLEGK